MHFTIIILKTQFYFVWCVYDTCVQWRSERGVRCPGLQEVESCLTVVLGTELRFSGRAANTLNG